MTIKEMQLNIEEFTASASADMDEGDLDEMRKMLERMKGLVIDEMDRVDRILTE